MGITSRIRPATRRVLAIGLAAVAGLGVAGSLGIAPDAARAAETSNVAEFPQSPRHLNGFWANESVPAYRCPASRPYLENHNYAPVGTSLINGVEVRQSSSPWPIGVSVTGAKAEFGTFSPAVGISDAPFSSSATNWAGGDKSYQVVLHCTDDPDQGWIVLRDGT
jgi:hypothetical protein